MRRLLVWTVVVVAGGVLPGCGGDQEVLGDPAGEVTRTAETYMAHLGRGEGHRACALLTVRAQRQLARNLEVDDAATAPAELCRAAAGEVWWRLGPDRGEAFAGIRVQRVRMDGDRARIADRDVVYPESIADVLVEDGRDTVLVHTPGGWRIDELG